ncbi:YihY/virulence factor BrkB family protein [Sphingomonas sp. BAUL-RG-20F-R05-02]|uniref:YihY/virulence factor BrkB family protein n=1 Tax=Sphingomonas sp. BAUL-RG-20F-R05-02 TaxID=2914830 RepID=UPI001F5869F5|nr:YihY/virulence factor BrkB family protein [Sphingomonas sp. BAUL-RG-20F-R05-02]
MPSDNDRGRTASSPLAMPLTGWKEVFVRTWSEAGDDNVGLVAAGVAFYGFLALVPLLGAIVLSYGLVADPQTVVHNMQGLTSVMPGDAAKLVGEQLMNVVKTSGSKKGLGLLLALALAVFGARSAAGSIVTALNIAYEEKEKRSFIVVNLLALGITAAGVVVAVLAVVAIAALGHLESLLPTAPGFLVILGKLLSYVALALAGAAGAATLYRYGPSRTKPRWVWLTPGSILAALLWLALTLGFGIYVANFGNYNATYGSLGAVVVLLTWLYLSSYILLFGAELNSELEHQTAEDTTGGASKPMGDRGAWAADHVAPTKAQKDESVDAAVQSIDAERDQLTSQPSFVTEYITARTGSRLGVAVGARRAGMLSSSIAVLGLGFMRRRGKVTQGLTLLAVAAGLNWLAREDENAPS